MATHGVVTAGTERGFHPGAGGAGAGDAQVNRPDGEAAIADGGEVDAGDDKVAAQYAGVDLRVAGQGGDDRQMFGLDQRHGAFAGAGVVACKAECGDLGAIHHQHVVTPDRAQADPGEPSGTGKAGGKAGECFHGCNGGTGVTRLLGPSALDNQNIS